MSEASLLNMGNFAVCAVAHSFYHVLLVSRVHFLVASLECTVGVGMQLSLGVKHEYHYGQDKMAAFLLLRHVSQKIWKTIDATGK